MMLTMEITGESLEKLAKILREQGWNTKEIERKFCWVTEVLKEYTRSRDSYRDDLACLIAFIEELIREKVKESDKELPADLRKAIFWFEFRIRVPIEERKISLGKITEYWKGEEGEKRLEALKKRYGLTWLKGNPFLVEGGYPYDLAKQGREIIARYIKQWLLERTHRDEGQIEMALKAYREAAIKVLDRVVGLKGELKLSEVYVRPYLI
ncbi:MAG: hypothetical protein DRI61_14720 [Chloroflexi bacterium]|nr:MAG: hypothetical protein DRI61_14720 [Chloroflexota bacterium]